MAASNVTRRIIVSPDLPRPRAPYSHAVQIGNWLYISGLVGIDSKIDELVSGGVVPEAKQALTNLGYALNAAGTSYKNVVKATVYLADIKDYEAVNAIYREFFKDPYPTRVMFQAVALPVNARIEIEAIAVVGNLTEA